jgi:hypothetical protein
MAFEDKLAAFADLHGVGTGSEVVECTVRVLYAHGLKIADTYSSDPYAVISCLESSGKTKVVKKSLNPVWDEFFVIQWTKSVDMTVRVYDKDFLKSDFLGQVAIRYADAKMHAGRPRYFMFSTYIYFTLKVDFFSLLPPRTYNLMPRDKNDVGVTGTISLLFTFPSSGKNVRRETTEPNSHTPPSHGVFCTIRIISATGLKNTDLIGNIDPYAVLQCGTLTKRTLVIDDTNEPVWLYSTKIIWPEAVPAIISVYDYDRLNSADFLGQVSVMAREAQDFGGKQKTFHLQGRSKKDKGIQGEITLQFLFAGMKAEEAAKPSLPPANIFGRSLEEIHEETNQLVPNFVMDSIQYLTDIGLNRQGK